MSLGVSRQINMARTYERLASSMLSMRYIRGDSLVYGLGIPFLAYAGRIECYQRSGWCVHESFECVRVRRADELHARLTPRLARHLT